MLFSNWPCRHAFFDLFEMEGGGIELQTAMAMIRAAISFAILDPTSFLQCLYGTSQNYSVSQVFKSSARFQVEKWSCYMNVTMYITEFPGCGLSSCV